MSECNVALQCITQYNSWAGSAQLTSQADPPPAQAPPVIWGQHSAGEQNIIFLTQKVRLLDFSVSHFARSSKKGHPLTLCCPWLGSVCSGVYDILAVRVDTSDGHYLGQKLSILFMPNSCPERVLECQFTGVRDRGHSDSLLSVTQPRSWLVSKSVISDLTRWPPQWTPWWLWQMPLRASTGWPRALPRPMELPTSEG